MTQPEGGGRRPGWIECRYLLSAVEPGQFPPSDVPEVVFSGRSNVGKSSLINFLTNNAGLAKVSKTPGKTRAVNFFAVGEKWRLVDLPGYGYARLSQEEIRKWGGLIDAYLRERENLALVVQLIDSRHPPTSLDLEMMEWLAQTGISTLIALTKVDKIGKNEARTVAQKFRKDWIPDLPWPVVPTSVLLGQGRSELLKAVESMLSDHSLWGQASSWSPPRKAEPKRAIPEASKPAPQGGGGRRRTPQSGATGSKRRDAKRRPR